MNTHLFGKYFDGELTGAETVELKNLLQNDAAAKRAFAEVAMEEGLFVEAAGMIADELELKQTKPGAEPVPVIRRLFPMKFVWSLAAAASLAIVAGVWWFNQRQDAGLGLRVAEIQRSEVGGQRSEVRVQRSGGKSVPAVVGMELRQGDRVAVGKGGKVGLKYRGEETKIDLMAVTEAAFGSEKGAKRVRLDGGKFVCSAAPQKLPFRIQTPHAMAEVVGTRFSLNVASAMTTLAVQEGKVALIQNENSLQVNSGETAWADSTGLKKLSAEDAWITDLFVRAEAGTWDALDFKRGFLFGDVGSWRAELRGEPAGRRIWQTDPRARSTVLFDAAKWKRGVVVGQVMLLPEGELSSALAVPTTLAALPWKRDGNVRLEDNLPGGGYLDLHWGSNPTISLMSVVTVKDHPRGVWHRFAVYFDTDVETSEIVAIAKGVWPADGTVPTAALWDKPRKADFRGITGNAVGIGLSAKQVPVLWQGLKVVPLGPDLPPPPPGVGEGK